MTGEITAETADRLLLCLASVKADHPELTGDDLMTATGRALDQLLGPLLTVVHQAGPVVEGGQLCLRCGSVLQDLYGAHVALAEGDADDPAWDLRHDRGWGEGSLVWELWRWGEPTTFPRALGLLPEGQTEPNEADLERWCEPPT